MTDKDNREELQVDEPDLVDVDSRTVKNNISKGAPEEEKEEEESQVVVKKEASIITKNPSEDSSSDNSAVMVEHRDVEEQPRALQIVKIGNEQDGECLCGYTV